MSVACNGIFGLFSGHQPVVSDRQSDAQQDHNGDEVGITLFIVQEGVHLQLCLQQPFSYPLRLRQHCELRS